MTVGSAAIQHDSRKGRGRPRPACAPESVLEQQGENPDLGDTVGPVTESNCSVRATQLFEQGESSVLFLVTDVTRICPRRFNVGVRAISRYHLIRAITLPAQTRRYAVQ